MEHLVSFSPSQLTFQITLGKQTETYVHLTNVSDAPISYKVKTTNLKRYCVRPNAAILQPAAQMDIEIDQQSFKTTPEDIDICDDRFLLMIVNLQNVPLGPSSEPSHVSDCHGYESVMELWKNVPEDKIYKRKITVSLEMLNQPESSASKPVLEPTTLPISSEKLPIETNTSSATQQSSQRLQPQSFPVQPLDAPTEASATVLPSTLPPLPERKAPPPPLPPPKHDAPPPPPPKRDAPPPPPPKRDAPPPPPPTREAPPPPPPTREAPPPPPPKRELPPPPFPLSAQPASSPSPPKPTPLAERELSPPTPPPAAPARLPEPPMSQMNNSITDKVPAAVTTDAPAVGNESKPPSHTESTSAVEPQQALQQAKQASQDVEAKPDQQQSEQATGDADKAEGIDYLSSEFQRKRVLEMRTAPKITVHKLDKATRRRIANERAQQIAKVIEDRQSKIDAVKLELREARHRLSDARMATSPAYDVAYEISESSRVPFPQIVIMAIISGALLQLLV